MMSFGVRSLCDPLRERTTMFYMLRTAQAARSNGCFAFTAHQEQLGGEGEPCVAEGVLTCEAAGSMTMDEYLSMLGITRRACVRIAAFNRTGLEKVFQPP